MKRATIKRAALAAGAALAVAWSLPAAAANITYSVDAYVGPFGHITGSVTTDGTIGLLNASNFLNWTLNVQGDGASDVLNDGNSGVFTGGTATTATAGNIFFDFGALNASFLLFQKNFSSGNSYACAASTPFPSTPCYQGASLVPENYLSPSAQFQLFEGNQIIASVAAVPEPATWAMMIAGFGLAGAAMRRRNVRTSVSYA